VKPTIRASVRPVGAEKKECAIIDLKARLEEIISMHTAGSPTDPDVKWTHLRPSAIAKLYQEKWGGHISNGTVKRLLTAMGYRRRRPNKALATGKSPFREQQFRILFRFAFLFAEMEGNPILSMDTKKKERLGNLARGGKVLCNSAPRTYDHDYAHLTEGKVVPAGLYDMKRNEGYLSIGTNHETAAFLADNLIWWWENHGIHHYPDATHLLIYCDCGGANGYRHHAFKKELQRAARHMGLRTVVVHYPPYCSKWNPIEHRLFSQLHRQAEGAVFTSYEQVSKIFGATTTTTGLKVFVRINDTQYEKGIKVTKEQIDEKRILYHPELPQFNYTIIP